MIRPLCRDEELLKQKAQKALPFDCAIGKDLMDTLLAHQEECVGMAANMIGIPKAIIAVHTELLSQLMYNPQIVHKEGKYSTHEGCLCLNSSRPAMRYRLIDVIYQDEQFVLQKQRFSGFEAQVIQHEMDHLEGILI